MIRRFSLYLATAAMLVISAPALAGPPGPPPVNPARVAEPKEGEPKKVTGKVQIEILCVRATNTTSNVDPKLQGIMQHLRILKYKGFDLIDEHDSEVSSGHDVSFDIEGGRKLQVELLDVNDVQAKIRMRMFSGKGSSPTLDTTVSVHRNRAFIVAGPKMEGDDVLILPVRVKY